MTSRPTFLAFSMIFGLVALAGSASVPAAAESAAVARGEAVAAEWCATCHAMGSDASRPYDAPAFVEIANQPDQELGALRAFLDGDHFPMTTHRLFPAERDDVSAYIMSLRRR